MAGSTLPPPQHVAILAAKLYDPDSDIRYMSLNDLSTVFTSSHAAAFLSADFNQCAKIVDGFLHTLNDTNGEVQNLTVKCLGPFVLKCHSDILCPLVHKLCALATDPSIDHSIPALAVRTVVVSLPRASSSVSRSKPIVDAYDAISRVLIPRLVGYIVIPHNDKTRPEPPKGLLQEDLENGTDSTFIDVLTEIARCYGAMLQPKEVKALEETALKLLESPRTTSVLKKKAVTALSALSLFFSDALLSSILSHVIESLRAPHLTSSNRRLYINLLGSMARAIPSKFGPHVKTLAPFIFSALSQTEIDEQMQGIEEEDERDPSDDEVREAALIALEAFLSWCGADMQRYNEEAIDAILRFLKYDPNLTQNNEEDVDAGAEEDDSSFDADEDFEEEGFGDDEDDVSWKVRRCAAKSLHTILSIRTKDFLDSAEAFDRVARALVDRFQEREESVRLEVLNALTFLVRSTEPHDELEGLSTLEISDRLLTQPGPSRKRRRGNSDASMSDSVKARRLTGSTSPESELPPRLGPPAQLAKIMPEIVQGSLRLIKSSTMASKQSAITLLKDLVLVRQGGSDKHLGEILDLLVQTIHSPKSDTRTSGGLTVGAGSTSPTSIQLEALRLTSELAKANSSRDVQPFIKNVVPAVSSAAQNKNPTVATEALKTSEQLVKVLTPPRMAHANSEATAYLGQLLNLASAIVSARSADLATRQQAIAVIGVLLGRTQNPQGSKLIAQQQKSAAFELLYESSKSETTRLASIRAIENLAFLASQKLTFDPRWLSKVCLELGGQLRKSDRALRGASMTALRTLIADRNWSGTLDKSTIEQLAALLQPVISSGDLQLLGSSLLVYAAIIRDSSIDIVNDDFIRDTCQLLSGPNGALVLDQLCAVMDSIGHRRISPSMMKALLKDVGISGSPAVVGKVIGDLLVASNRSAGITVDDFLRELKTAPDEKRRCLALSVIGEVGLRSGLSSSLAPDLFVSYLTWKSDDVPLAAAVALGRAAAGVGNAKTYIPVILSCINTKIEEQYLVLHSVRELLQYNENARELSPFAGPLWDASVAAARSEDSRGIGAECIADLTMIEPKSFLPTLQVSFMMRSSSLDPAELNFTGPT